MERRHMSDRQFLTLYNHHLPGLYRAALFLTGDNAVAEKATRQAFLQTALQPASAADERVFGVEAAKKLYAWCEKLAPDQYECPLGFDDYEFPKALNEMTLSQRGAVIFRMLGYSEQDIAGVIRVSRMTVRGYLNKYMPRLRMARPAEVFAFR